MLEINNVSFSYTREVLQNLSFTLNEGEFLGLVGPNGSGKTTLLRLLAGYFVPQQGTVKLKQKNIQRYKPKERARIVAVVPQYHLANMYFTVEQLIQLGREPYHNFFQRSGQRDRELIMRVMQELELLGFEQRVLKTLSGGELQRVLIAKALVQDTPLIIMDEPTNHLDIHHQISVLKLIKEYQRLGKTIISVFHDLNFAAKFSDRILVLNKKIEALGRPAEVLNEEILARVFQTKDFLVNQDLRVVLK